MRKHSTFAYISPPSSLSLEVSDESASASDQGQGDSSEDENIRIKVGLSELILCSPGGFSSMILASFRLTACSIPANHGECQ